VNFMPEMLLSHCSEVGGKPLGWSSLCSSGSSFPFFSGAARRFCMKHSFRILTVTPVALGIVVSGVLGTNSPAFARRKLPINLLQIWPARRALIVLPLKVNANFLNGDSDTQEAPSKTDTVATPDTAGAPAANTTAPVSAPADGSLAAAPISSATPISGSDELANALIPLVSGQLSRALQNTGKFSLISPYRFDPILRRGENEQQISDADLTTFVTTPTLDGAQSVLPKLSLDQPGMVAQITLENLQVGGTPQDPTVSVRMHGDLYQVPNALPTASTDTSATTGTGAGTDASAATTDASAATTTPAPAPASPTGSPAPQLFRTITITTRAYPGATPEDRLRAATNEGFNDIAAAFVAPPTEFQLPAPIVSSPAGNSKARGKTNKGMGTSSNTTKGNSQLGSGASGGNTNTPLLPAAPTDATITAPNPLSPSSNAPIAPTLPPAAPPLGLNVPAQGG